jgi:hypothetical protein
MRPVWVMLFCLLAVYPPQACACDLLDHHSRPVHEHEHGHEHDDPLSPDCPCRCHLAPHDAVTAPRVLIDTTDHLTFPVGDVLFVLNVRFDPTLAVVRCGQPPPPGPYADLPLYLSTSRLRN